MIQNFGKIRKFIFPAFVVMAAGLFFVTNTSLAAVKPDAPTNVKATAGDGQATVTFTPGKNYGVEISKYFIILADNKTAEAKSSPIIVKGLKNGTTYQFAVRAQNTAGATSDASSLSNQVTPKTATASPTSPTGSTGSTTTPTTSSTGTLAQPGSQAIGVGVDLPGTGIKSMGQYTFSVYVRAIYAYSMKVAVALATLMVIYAGYKYLTSRGDSSAINEAKDILFSTLLGAALLMLVVLVGNIVGLNIDINSSSITTSSLPLLTTFG